MALLWVNVQFPSARARLRLSSTAFGRAPRAAGPPCAKRPRDWE